MSGDTTPLPLYAFMSCVGGNFTFTVYPCVSVRASNDCDKSTHLSRHQSVRTHDIPLLHSVTVDVRLCWLTVLPDMNLHQSLCPAVVHQNVCPPVVPSYFHRLILVYFVLCLLLLSITEAFDEHHQHRAWSTYPQSSCYLAVYDRCISAIAVQYLGQLNILQSKA
jgi:hypothetical protein